jgi:fatty acid desaturase
MHHTYTNVREMDHDIGYGLLRLFPEQKWEPRFLINPIAAAVLATTFEWTLALQSLELEKLLSKEKTFAQVKEEFVPIFAKMRKQFIKDYVFFPVIAGPMFLPVITGNFTANLIRNFWTFSIIFCGHFTENAETFSKDVLVDETRGQWYLRQLRGSSNLSGGKLLHYMSGNLSHQIEHHMFPDVPGMRYAEMSIKVQEICARYGQHYNTGSFPKQFSTVVKRIFKYSLPFGTKVEAMADSVVAKAAEIVPMSKSRLPSFISRLAA